jgi:two-component system sensor histidine kinase BaeS
MFNRLRTRFVLSHILPLLIIIPLMGLALIYVLETQVLLENLSSELKAQASLAAEIMRGHQDLWLDPQGLQTIVNDLQTQVEARVMVLDARGILLASSDPDDSLRVGFPVEAEGVSAVLAGETSVRATYSRSMRNEIVDVLVPVMSDQGEVAGAVRMSHHLLTVSERFVRLRYLVGGVLVGGLLLGGIVGWILALSLERPLKQVTSAISQLGSGEQTGMLLEEGPVEIRQLSTTMNSMVARLRSMEAARRQLLANLVHELGRPLGALRSASQALLGGAGEQAELRKELLVGMDDEINRLRHLVDDLAGLYDQVLGGLELRRQPVALHSWLDHCLPPWREEAQDKGLEWDVSLPETLPVLSLDEDRLAQALGNLLSNAIKFTPSGGRVTMEAGVDGDQVWLRVSDTGPGIDPAEQAHIFDPFYRIRTGRRFPQGMGLGLTIARDAVNAHGGRLEVQSAPGEGSCFTIWLPAAQPPR